jgi:cyclase
MITIDSNVIVETEHLGSNNSIICTREGLVLVDSPHRPSDAMKWRRTVESCGRAIYLINTDHHPDHTIGNFFLPGTVVSHEQTRKKLLHSAPSPEYLDALLDVIDPQGKMYMEAYAPRVPTLTYTGTMTLHVGGLDFELTHLPGHTLNSTLVTIPQQGIAFTGDLVCEAGLPAFIEADTYAWIDAVRRIEGMDLRYIVPGHGSVCGIDAARRFRGQMEDLVGEVERRIEAGQARERVAAEVTYEDRIHTPIGESPGYPQHLIDLFMRGSIETIYDHVLARHALPTSS